MTQGDGRSPKRNPQNTPKATPRGRKPAQNSGRPPAPGKRGPAKPRGGRFAAKPQGRQQGKPQGRQQGRPQAKPKPKPQPQQPVEVYTGPMVETPAEGILEIDRDRSGFLRPIDSLIPGPADVYVAASQVAKFNLRTGQRIVGIARSPRPTQKYPALLRVEAVEGRDPEEAKSWPDFQSLTPLTPHERLRVEIRPTGYGARVIDLMAPIGKGQRGVIVSPPKAGKTFLLKEIAQGVHQNYPEMPIFLLLIDERPEEVTDFRMMGIGEVIASSFDQMGKDHLRVAELALHRCIRLVESGADVLLLLDSLTRLTRASNLATRGTGRTLTGGLDPSALTFPRQLLGAARKMEGGGSLTVLATALIETGSRLDDHIFEEFKGTGNWELRLDRRIAERRIFPAFNLAESGTRREELLYTEDEHAAVNRLRRALFDGSRDPADQMQRLLQLLEKVDNNADLVQMLLKK